MIVLYRTSTHAYGIRVELREIVGLYEFTADIFLQSLRQRDFYRLYFRAKNFHRVRSRIILSFFYMGEFHCAIVATDYQ